MGSITGVGIWPACWGEMAQQRLSLISLPGWRSLHVIHNRQAKLPGAAGIGPPEPTIKETGLCLIIKLEPQRTRRLSILTPHLKKNKETEPDAVKLLIQGHAAQR